MSYNKIERRVIQVINTDPKIIIGFGFWIYDLMKSEIIINNTLKIISLKSKHKVHRNKSNPLIASAKQSNPHNFHNYSKVLNGL